MKKIEKVMFHVFMSKAISSKVSFLTQDLVSHPREKIILLCLLFREVNLSLKRTEDLLPFYNRTELIPGLIFNPFQTFCCSLFPSSHHVDSSMMRYWLPKWLVREA